MLFSSLLLALPGHTPASVVAARPCWYVLLGMLCVLSVMNLVSLEIIGSLLSCLMLFLAWLITRKNMLEAPRYVVIYAVLCVLNFFFDVVPLIMSLHGRSTVTVQPGYSTSYEGIEQTTYTRTVRTTPFFEAKQGLLYNLESISMILSPVSMLVGTYLAVRAQCEIQQAAPLEGELPREMERALERAPPRPATPPPPPRFDPKKTIGATAPLGFFDPIGICPKDETVFNEYRACELKHGRVAMLAALGAVAQHYVRLPGFTLTNFGKPLPSGLGAVTETPGSFGFVVLLGLCGALELFLWKDGIDVEAGKWTKEPGNFGDPLGLGQYNEDMRNRELNNGRFAMFAAFGIIAAELVTGKDAVQQVGL